MISTKPPKPKTCSVCKTSFTPQRMGAKVCSPQCAMTYARSVNGKAAKVAAIKDKRETKQRLDKLKSRSQHAYEAQKAFNAMIRIRDVSLPCISCQRHHQGQYHAGHYLSVGARPELRFEPLNVHKQCAPCNNHLSGNVVLYRISLLRKIGLEKVEWLEGPHELKKYSIADYIQIKANYTALTRAFEKA